MMKYDILEHAIHHDYWDSVNENIDKYLIECLDNMCNDKVNKNLLQIIDDNPEL